MNRSPRVRSQRDLRALPKAHLHLHLDGAIREDTLIELCEAHGLPVPELPSGRAYSSFAAFMDAITAAHAVLRRPDDLVRVVREIVADSADDGAVWIEVSLWPGLFGSTSAGIAALEVVLDAGTSAGRDFDVGFGVMVAANRHEPPERAGEMARIAARFASAGVVSFGLDGDETASPPDAYADAFQVARNAGLRSTPHAGEPHR